MLKKFKKSLRLAGLVLLIVLALSGIGLPGAVKIPTRHRKEDQQEQVEEIKEKKATSVFELRN